MTSPLLNKMATYDDFVRICNYTNKTFSFGPKDQVHCPRDSPMNRAQGVKVTYLNGYLHCNERASVLLNVLEGIQMVDIDPNGQHPKSRTRFKAEEQYNLWTLINMMEHLFM
jgi:hypothetical protein